MRVTLPAGRNWPGNWTLLRMMRAGLYGEQRGPVFNVRATFHRPPEVAAPIVHGRQPHGKVTGRTRSLKDKKNMHWESDRFGFGYFEHGVDLTTYSYVRGVPPWEVGGDACRTLCTVPYETEVELRLTFGERATLYEVRRGETLATATVEHDAGGWDVGYAGSLYQGGEADTRLSYDYAVTLVRIR
jgi:hypothetical protein